MSTTTLQETPTTDIGLPDEPLTAEELTFARLVAKGFTYTRAYRLAFPAKAHLKNNTIRARASELVSKSNIQSEVATSQTRAAHLVRLGEDRIEEILTDGSITSKHNKVADVAMFMYEQGNGKAVQKVQHAGVFVNVQYDLSGGKAGPVPQEVLDALED